MTAGSQSLLQGSKLTKKKKKERLIPKKKNQLDSNKKQLNSGKGNESLSGAKEQV